MLTYAHGLLRPSVHSSVHMGVSSNGAISSIPWKLRKIDQSGPAGTHPT